MESIYTLSDAAILQRIGNRVKSVRLRQNIIQSNLAEASGISLSTLKKIEGGAVCSVDSLLRVLRTLGLLDVLQSLIEEEQLSPSEYYKLVNSAQKKTRKRAAGKLNRINKEDAEW